MKTKTPLSRYNRHFDKAFAQKLSWRKKKGILHYEIRGWQPT